MVFPGERGLSQGNQNEFLPTANELAERIAMLDEKIAYGGPSGQRKAQRDRDGLFHQWAAHYPNHLIATPPVDAILPPVEHAESVSARSAKKSELVRGARQLLIAGTIAASAAVAPAFVARADEPSPLQPISGSIGTGVRVDFMPSPDPNIYMTIPLQLQKIGLTTDLWIRFPANVGDLFNGWGDALRKLSLKVSDQCVKTIASWNLASFQEVSGQTSGWVMNAREAPVKVSVAPTITVNGKQVTNDCRPIGDLAILRVQQTRTPSAIVPLPASTGQNNEDEKRKNTLLGGALFTFLLGLGGGAFWWKRRRNQMGTGLTSMVQEMPTAHTHQSPQSYPASDPKRLDSPLDALVGEAATLRQTQQIRNWAGSGGDETESAIEVHAQIRDQFRKNPQPRQQPVTIKPQGK